MQLMAETLHDSNQRQMFTQAKGECVFAFITETHVQRQRLRIYLYDMKQNVACQNNSGNKAPVISCDTF